MKSDSKKENNEVNTMTDELKLQSEVEASEQKPLDEDLLSKLNTEMAELKDQHIRLMAEFDNYKKRNLKEKSELIRTAGSDVITALLPVLDDFERALKLMEGIDDKDPVKEGLLLVYHKLKLTLEQKGLKPMQSIGEEFNVDVHEAITNVPAQNDKQKGRVVDEVERGYWLNDKVLRHARVVVAN